MTSVTTYQICNLINKKPDDVGRSRGADGGGTASHRSGGGFFPGPFDYNVHCILVTTGFSRFVRRASEQQSANKKLNYSAREDINATSATQSADGHGSPVG
ncbi:hypothetical protein LSAT2_004595 [Lamellibrachia satsuma]|nr:hypothetical protein LSAT2_004595 [Lamellibrachia satsuma]